MSLDYMLSVPEEQFDLQEAYWPFTAMGEIDDECYLPKGETCIALSAALGRLAETRDDVFAFEDTNTRLPAVCGLKVKGDACIPIPLTEKYAKLLLDKCTKSDVGEKRWELAGSQVEMENPIWNVRLKELLHRVGIELGYGLVILDAELEKLVVYEPGGRLMRHKCAEDVAGEVAKLVVQLPSMFTGGDLVVYSDEDSSKHCRMDMGKKADTAAYSPCCAVYVAGAEHAVEEVKNGYRVVLVYSLRVPEDEYSPGVTRAGQLVVREMCDSMAEFGEKESFALLLSTNYGYAGLEKKGIELLKDEDRRQFDALQKANALLPPEKQLKFYLVELNQSTELIRDVCIGGGAYYRNRGFEPVSRSGNGVVGTPWEVTGNSESSVWFSINGEKLRDWDFEHGGDPLQWSAHLNFLNPGTLSPREMWSDHMSRDGLVDEQTIEYTAHAIVGWPLARDLENTSTLIGEGAAIKGILAENPVKFLKLRTLMEIAVGNENDKEHRCSWDNSVSPYMNFCQDMCSAIAAAGDVSLVGKFFTKFFGRLKNKQQLAPTILIMMNQFGWDAIAAHLTGAMNQQNQHDALVFAVKLADDCRAEAKFESPATMLAIEKARGVPGEVLSSFDHLGLLWKCASTCPSPAAFTAIETLLKNLDGGLLAPVLTCISSCVDQASPTNQRSALTALVSSRCQWLAGEISRQHKVFSWEMPDAHFPANAEVENFLPLRSHSVVLVVSQQRVSLLVITIERQTDQTELLRTRCQHKEVGKMPRSW